MEANVVSLRPLYEFVKREHAENHAEPKGMGSHLHAEGKDFGRQAKEILLGIPDTVPGLFLLGKFVPGQQDSQWVGTHLCHSLRLGSYAIERVKKSRAFLYRCFYGEDTLERACREYFPENFQKFWGQWKGAFEYAGSTYLAWVTLPGLKPEDLIDVKANLKGMGITEGLLPGHFADPKTNSGKALRKLKEVTDSVKSVDRFMPDDKWYSRWLCK